MLLNYKNNSTQLFYVYNKSNVNLNASCVIDYLAYNQINIQNIEESLLRNLDKKDLIDNPISNPVIGFSQETQNLQNFQDFEYEDFNENQGNAKILEQQKRELEKMLREEEEKKRKIKQEEEKKKQEVNLNINIKIRKLRKKN